MNSNEYKLGDKVFFMHKNKVEESEVCGLLKSQEYKNKNPNLLGNRFPKEIKTEDTVTVLHEDNKSEGLTLPRVNVYPSKEELLASL